MFGLIIGVFLAAALMVMAFISAHGTWLKMRKTVGTAPISFVDKDGDGLSVTYDYDDNDTNVRYDWEKPHK